MVYWMMFAKAIVSVIAGVLFIASALSFMTNPNPRWFDFIGIIPLIYISVDLLLGGNALERHLDSTFDTASKISAFIKKNLWD